MLNIDNIILQKGSHKDREAGFCAMELVAYMANEPHSDAPQCACPVLTKYVVRLNDKFNDDERQLLKPYLTKLIGTRDGKSLERAKLLAFRAGNVFAPIAAEIAGRLDLAALMRDVEFGDWKKQQTVCKEAQTVLRDAADAAAYAYAYAAYAYAADAAAYAADAAAYAADAAAYAYAYAAAYADAAYAADAAAYAADAAAYAYAYAAAYAAAAAKKNKEYKNLRNEIVNESLEGLRLALEIK